MLNLSSGRMIYKKNDLLADVYVVMMCGFGIAAQFSSFCYLELDETRSEVLRTFESIHEVCCSNWNHTNDIYRQEIRISCLLKYGKVCETPSYWNRFCSDVKDLSFVGSRCKLISASCEGTICAQDKDSILRCLCKDQFYYNSTERTCLSVKDSLGDAQFESRTDSLTLWWLPKPLTVKYFVRLDDGSNNWDSFVTFGELTIGKLTPGTKYNFDVVSEVQLPENAFQNAKNINFTSRRIVWTRPAKPGSIVSVTEEYTNASQQNNNWYNIIFKASEGNVFEYKITVKMYGDSKEVCWTTNNKTTVQCKLSPGQVYKYTIVACNGNNDISETTSGNFTIPDKNVKDLSIFGSRCELISASCEGTICAQDKDSIFRCLCEDQFYYNSTERTCLSVKDSLGDAQFKSRTDSLTLWWLPKPLTVKYFVRLDDGSNKWDSYVTFGELTIGKLTPGTKYNFDVVSEVQLPENAFQNAKNINFTNRRIVWTRPAKPGSIVSVTEEYTNASQQNNNWYNIIFKASEGKVFEYKVTVKMYGDSNEVWWTTNNKITVQFKLSAGQVYKYTIVARNGNNDISETTSGNFTIPDKDSSQRNQREITKLSSTDPIDALTRLTNETFDKTIWKVGEVNKHDTSLIFGLIFSAGLCAVATIILGVAWMIHIKLRSRSQEAIQNTAPVIAFDGHIQSIEMYGQNARSDGYTQISDTHNQGVMSDGYIQISDMHSPNTITDGYIQDSDMYSRNELVCNYDGLDNTRETIDKIQSMPASAHHDTALKEILIHVGRNADVPDEGNYHSLPLDGYETLRSLIPSDVTRYSNIKDAL